jgi:flagellar M-ring protein FliF
MKKFLLDAIDQLKKIFANLAGWQKAGVAAIGLLFIIGAVYLAVIGSRTEYGVLFSNLAEQDAAVIVNKLKEAEVPYRLENGGATIHVPSSQVYELRLQLASEGLPQSGIVGYEIFDKTNVGITEFVQKLNYKRALEGELARTIKSLKEIAGARVHIMIPEPRLFTEQEKEATASVLLSLKAGVQLKPNQIDGIMHLVASSVEGMKTENVTVVDANGNVLSNNQQRDTMASLTSGQLDMQRKVEAYFTDKVQSLLDGVVGRNNALVRVTAELSFDQVERNSETYDPESPVVRSEQKTTEASAGADSSGGKSESTITNFEINKTIERVIGGVGRIARLSVAVMVNGSYRETTGAAGDKVMEYVPRSDEEMRKLGALVRNAVGFDAARNDQVDVTNIAFDLTEAQRLREDVESSDLWETIRLVAMYGSMAVACVALFLMLRSMFRTLAPPPTPKFEEPEAVELEPLRIDAETQLRIQKQQLVADLSKEKPDDIARLIHSWIVEGDKS